MEKIDRQFLENIFGTNPEKEDLQEAVKCIIEWIAELEDDSDNTTIKAQPQNLETRDGYLRLFNEWSLKMDEIYGGNTPERNDATMWTDENPANWMELYNEQVFDAWCQFDSGNPMWDSELRLVR